MYTTSIEYGYTYGYIWAIYHSRMGRATVYSPLGIGMGMGMGMGMVYVGTYNYLHKYTGVYR